MTRKRALAARNKLVARLANLDEVLRGSLLERTIHHTSGCPKCARGEGHPLGVLNMGYPGGKTRQLSLRPRQVPQPSTARCSSVIGVLNGRRLSVRRLPRRRRRRVCRRKQHPRGIDKLL